jgi:hypothetical protein
MTKPLHHLAPVDIQILRAVNRFRYLTAAQLNRVLWPDNTRDENRYAQRRLKHLAEAGYLQAVRDLPRPAVGTAARVYAVARRGRDALRELGESVPDYYRPSETDQALHNPLFMPHTLAVIDVLIAAERLTQEEPDVKFEQLLLERDLRRLQCKVEVPAVQGPLQSRRVTVVSDAVFTLVVNGTPQHFVLELDRDTERRVAWQRKVAALTLWIASPDSRGLLPGPYVFVMVVTPTWQRREQLRLWTAQELRARSLYDQYAPIYAITDVSPVATEPVDFFTGSYWYPPFTGSPDSLVDLLIPEQSAYRGRPGP